MTQLEGMWIGNCHVLRRIGGGGMGDVYLAEQPALGRNVAIKVVRAQEGDGAVAAVARNDDRERADAQLAHEARAIAALDHPHILPLYEFGEQDQLRYLVMPYVERGSLADLLRQGPPWGWTAPLAPTLAVSITEQTAGALQFAHDRHVIHRDVKPGNLLVRLLQHKVNQGEGAPSGSPAPIIPPYALEPDDVHILLADFGLARSVGDSQVNTGARGTPLYSAPEQLQGKPSAASDQYALACVAYYLLTGHPVFIGNLAEICYQHMNVPPTPPSSLLPTLTPAVDAAILRALAKQPEARFPSVLAFSQALRGAFATPQTLAPSKWTSPAPRREGVLAKLAAARSEERPAPVSALPDATTQADGVPGQMASRRERPSIPSRLPWQKQLGATDAAPPVTAAPAADDGRRPDGPAGQLPFARRRGRVQSLLASPSLPRLPGQNAGAVVGMRRVIVIGLAVVLLLGVLGGGGWLFTHRPQTARTTRAVAQVGSITFLGPVSLTSAVGATQTPMVTLPPTGSAAQRTGPLSTVDASLSAFSRLATLDAPAPDGSATKQALASAAGPEGTLSAGHPWQTSMDSDGQTTLIVSDDIMTAVRVTTTHTLDVRGMASARTLFDHALAPADTLDQPRIVYDPVTKRWALVMRRRIGVASAPTGGSLDIAVSATDDPLGSWNVYQLSPTIQTLSSCVWLDDPRIGSNAVSVTLTANLFACGAHGQYLGAGLWDISRASIFTGTRPTVYEFSGFANSAGKPVIGVVPAVQRGDDTTQWLLSDSASYANGAQPSSEVILWALEHPNGAAGIPALVGVDMQAPTSYADPPALDQDSGSGAAPLAMGDARPTQVIVRSGRLFATFVTAAHWSGDTLARPAIYWLIAPLPSTQNGKPPMSSQLSGVGVASAGVWGAPGSAYFAPAAMVAPSGALTLAAVRVTSGGHAPSVVMTTRTTDATSASPGPTARLTTDTPPLLWSGQSGASLGASLTNDSTDQSAQTNTIWLVSVTATGGSRWRVQLWQTPER